MIVGLLAILIQNSWEKYDVQTKWKSFCERHLIADDPWDEKEQRKLRELREREEDLDRENEE